VQWGGLGKKVAGAARPQMVFSDILPALNGGLDWHTNLLLVR